MFITKNELKSILNASSTDNLLEETFKGAEFDSRKVKRDNIFFALKGNNTHGENFLDTVFANGAKLAVIENSQLLTNSIHKDRLLCVKDSVTALADLASYISKNKKQIFKKDITFLGITGSLGKTTTRSILSHILTSHLPGFSSKGSFNNHIGLPYTICNLKEEDNWLVLEMGMNHSGEISFLSKIAIPESAAITCVSAVHMEYFNSIDEIADAKLEITEGLKSILCINHDDKLLLSKTLKKSKNTSLKLFTFGYNEESDFRIIKTTEAGFHGIDVEIKYKESSHIFKLPLLGKHNAYNLAAALCLAVSTFPELDISKVNDSLKNLQPETDRLNYIKLNEKKALLSDCYNASAESTIAGIEFVSRNKKSDEQFLLALGKLAEVGDKEEEYYKQIADSIMQCSVNSLITIGDEPTKVVKYLKESKIKIHNAKDTNQALEIIKNLNFDILLIKGSRSAKLEKIREELTKNLE